MTEIMEIDCVHPFMKFVFKFDPKIEVIATCLKNLTSLSSSSNLNLKPKPVKMNQPCDKAL